VVIVLLAVAVAELCLHGTQKLPFTCSYLPGKSNFNISFLLCSMMAYIGHRASVRGGAGVLRQRCWFYGHRRVDGDRGGWPAMERNETGAVSGRRAAV
jgi:hypothetical protein